MDLKHDEGSRDLCRALREQLLGDIVFRDALDSKWSYFTIDIKENIQQR